MRNCIARVTPKTQRQSQTQTLTLTQTQTQTLGYIIRAKLTTYGAFVFINFHSTVIRVSGNGDSIISVKDIKLTERNKDNDKNKDNNKDKTKDKDKDKNKDWSMPDERRPVDDNLRARDELVKIFMDAEDKNISA